MKASIWPLIAAIGATASILAGLTGTSPTMWGYPAVGLALVAPLIVAVAESRAESVLWLERTFGGLAPHLRLVSAVYAVIAIGWFLTVPDVRSDLTVLLAAVAAGALLGIAALGRRMGFDAKTPATSVDPRAVAHTMGSRLRTTSKRTRIGLLTGAVAVIVVLMVATWQMSPSTRAVAAMSKLLNRELPSEIARPAALAGEMGLDRAPAGIAFRLDGWSTKDGATPGSLVATWKLIAQGANGKQVISSPQGVTFTSGESALAWTSFVGSPPDLADLVSAVSDRTAAEKLAQDTSQASKPFGVIASLREADEPNPAATAPEPVYVDNQQWLKTDTNVAVPMKDAVLRVTYLDVGDATYRVLAEAVEAVPATIERGTLTPSELTDSAAATLSSIGAARTSGNTASLTGQLVNADGLDPSGLAAAVIDTPSAESLQLTGQFGDYRTGTGSGAALQFRDGRWVLDYTGQPLSVLVAVDPVTFKGHTFKYDNPYSSDNGKTYYDIAPVRVSLTPTVVRSGDTAFRLDIAWTRPQLKKYEISGYGYGGGSGQIWIRDLQLNGSSYPVPALDCSFSGSFTLDRAHCLTPDLPIPAGGLKAVNVSVAIGTTVGSSEYLNDGLLTAAPASPSANSAAEGAVLVAAKNGAFVASELRVPAAAPFAMRFVNLDASTSYKVRIVDVNGSVVWEGDAADTGEHIYQIPGLAAGNYRVGCAYHQYMDAAMTAGPTLVTQP